MTQILTNVNISGFWKSVIKLNIATIVSIVFSFGFYLIGRFITKGELAELNVFLAIIYLFAIIETPLKNIFMKTGILIKGADSKGFFLSITSLQITLLLIFVILNLGNINDVFNVDKTTFAIASIYLLITVIRSITFANIELNKAFEKTAIVSIIEASSKFIVPIFLYFVFNNIVYVLIGVIMSYILSTTYGLIVLNKQEEVINYKKIKIDSLSSITLIFLGLLLFFDSLLSKQILSIDEAAQLAIIVLFSKFVFFIGQNLNKVFFSYALTTRENNLNNKITISWLVSISIGIAIFIIHPMFTPFVKPENLEIDTVLMLIGIFANILFTNLHLLVLNSVADIDRFSQLVFMFLSIVLFVIIGFYTETLAGLLIIQSIFYSILYLLLYVRIKTNA